jgi:hypothetical protein
MTGSRQRSNSCEGVPPTPSSTATASNVVGDEVVGAPVRPRCGGRRRLMPSEQKIPRGLDLERLGAWIARRPPLGHVLATARTPTQ